MGLLHDELAKLKAAASRAFDFADPATYIAEKEHAFKEAIADAFHALEERVVALEQRIAGAVAPSQPAPQPTAAPAVQVQAPEPAAPIATLVPVNVDQSTGV